MVLSYTVIMYSLHQAGTFTTASVDVIQKRQIKTAKRRIANDGQVGSFFI